MTASAPDLREMARLATLPAVELLAQTRAALLLVDLQNRFLFGEREGSPPSSTARVIEPTRSLLELARSRGIPRFFITVGYAPGAADAGPWMRRIADMGVDVRARLEQPPLPPWASEIPDVLAPLPGEIRLTKYRVSAFFETGLDVLLRGAGIETVVMCGVASYGCIIASYIDACSRGFYPLLCTDGVDGHDERLHRTAMDFMGPNCRLSAGEIARVWSRA